MRGVSRSDWILVPSGSYVGTVRSFRLKKPGTYYLQMVYYKAFLSEPPILVNGKLSEKESSRLGLFWEELDRDELFRSNAVRITVVEKADES